MKVELTWATPGGDDLVAKMARVSNPANEDNKETAPKLIRYLINHQHWSPFEMVNACVQLDTTRDIAHQILRHRSFSFQEFSGRYAAYNELRSREGRRQHPTSRQHSLPLEDAGVGDKWTSLVEDIRDRSLAAYRYALDLGIAKECARAVLPEGLVPTSMYMNGSLRSWIHYWQVRCTPETQKEHRLVAEVTREVILPQFPMIAEAINGL